MEIVVGWFFFLRFHYITSCKHKDFHFNLTFRLHNRVSSLTKLLLNINNLFALVIVKQNFYHHWSICLTHNIASHTQLNSNPWIKYQIFNSFPNPSQNWNNDDVYQRRTHGRLVEWRNNFFDLRTILLRVEDFLTWWMSSSVLSSVPMIRRLRGGI